MLKAVGSYRRFHDDDIKWKHFPRYWPFVRGIHWSPVNSPHKGQWRGALMFSLICVLINDWVNNRQAGDLRRHRAHYDVIVMASVSNIHTRHIFRFLHCYIFVRAFAKLVSAGQRLIREWAVRDPFFQQLNHSIKIRNCISNYIVMKRWMWLLLHALTSTAV